jgi:hypothetical protein
MVPEAPLEKTEAGLVPGGEGWFVLNAREARWRDRTDWGGYTVDEVADRHGAGVERETSDADEAYARFPERVPARYGEGWLPSSE